MTSTINSTGTVNGVTITSDSSGALALQVAGTDALSISSSGIFTGLTSQSVTSFLSGNITLTLANTWYDGPNTGSIGANGQKWLIIAKGEITWTGGAIAGEIAIWDGSAYVAGSSNVGAAANWTAINVALYYVTLTGPTTFTLRAAANQNGALLVGNSSYYTVPKSVWITAIRLS